MATYNNNNNNSPNAYHVAVIGAGVIGLSSAVCIQEARPDCRVTLMAETFSPLTTSDGSGGLWYPFYMADTDPALVAETGKATYDHLKRLCMSPAAGEARANLLTMYFLKDVAKRDENDYIPYVDGFRWLGQREIESFPGARSGFSFKTMTVDVVSYLPWLMARFKANGGKVERKKIDCLAQLSDRYDVIVNCCGLGAARLLNDEAMTPIKGQVMRVDAPWVRDCFIFKTENDPALVYLIPGSRTCVVGGTAGKDEWDTTVNEGDNEDIWKRAVSVFPHIAKAQKVRTWAGLRPTRLSMRLEVERMTLDGKTLPVIHNYGHGGSGVTLHWGCALKVVSMVTDLLPATTHMTTVDGRNPLRHKL